MAAKGTKRGRGRAKATETEPETAPTTEPGTEPGTEQGTEPTTSPEAPVTPREGAEEGPAAEQPVEEGAVEEGAGEARSEPRAEDTPSAQPEETGPSEPIGRPDPARPSRTEAPAAWGVSHLVVTGLTAVLVAAIVALALLYATAGGTGRIDQQAQRLDALATHSQTQASRLDAAEGAIEGLRSEIGQLSSTASDLQSTAETNRQNLEQITAAIEDLRGAVNVPADGVAGEAVAEIQNTIQTLDERVASLEEGSDLDDLTGRIARLEEEISGLREQTAQRIEQAESATALGRAYAGLTQRIAAGEPFAEELQAVTAELPSAPGLETLRPIAGQGAPTVLQLRARLDDIAAGLPGGASEDGAADDGVWQTMRQRIENMVTVRRADEVDWPAVLARADEALQQGNVEAAISEIEEAGGTPPGEIEAWLADARLRHQVETGLNELSDAVLRQFAGRQ